MKSGDCVVSKARAGLAFTYFSPRAPPWPLHATRMAQGNVPYLNSRISLVTKSGIRYEGTLYSVDPKESTFALANGASCSLRLPVAISCAS